MDNDIKLKKVLASTYRKIKFKLDYSSKNVKFNNEASNLIAEKIKEGKPLMVARFGAVEMRCVDSYLKGKEYAEKIKTMATINAGIFPNNKQTIDKFCEYYLRCSQNIDILSLWQVKSEKKVIDTKCQNAQFINLRGLEPYYFNNPWSKELEGKKVLIIHPFKDSILNQYLKRDTLFDDKNILPKFKNLDVIKAVQSNAGSNSRFKDWFEAFDYMCKEIDIKDFDIAIIGAGSYGLPLACYIKELGKQAIQMAGATQILFGIKGKRWDNHEYISKLYKESWVRPLANETPERAKSVEGGSYW